MKVLLAASEVAPIVKVGGLGDVLGSLPKALEKLGIDADVIVPFYSYANTSNINIYKTLDLEVPFNNIVYHVAVFKTEIPNSNVDVFLLKNDEYFAVTKNAMPSGIKQTEMYVFFSRAVVEYIKASYNTYDIVHCHDWHTGMLTHILEEELGESRPKTLFTIHNLFYQGLGDASIVKELGIYPGEHVLIDWDLKDGDLNLMQQGVTSSDFISTVSKNYAEEIKTEEYGAQLCGILKEREDVLYGILNGLDYSFFPRNFDKYNWKVHKAKTTTALQSSLNLQVSDKPIFSFVSRLDPGQKGLDILYTVIPEIVYRGGQFVLLGTGEKKWEDMFAKLQNQQDLKDNISCNFTFDVELANKIYAGSDFLLIPSKYEPCGLTQMIAMWYGTLPIVRATGGLKDSVVEGHNGFVFKDYSHEGILSGIKNAFALFKNRSKYDFMVSNALDADFSWDKSALEYKNLYTKMVEN